MSAAKTSAIRAARVEQLAAFIAMRADEGRVLKLDSAGYQALAESGLNRPNVEIAVNALEAAGRVRILVEPRGIVVRLIEGGRA